MDKLCKIRDLQRAVHQFESAFEKRYGICLNEGMTLCSLSKTGRLCPGELGELLGLTPSNTSKVLRSVEQKGLVTRELCNEDRRQMYYSLTQQGRTQLVRLTKRYGGNPLPGGGNTRNPARLALRVARDATKHSNGCPSGDSRLSFRDGRSAIRENGSRR